MYRAGKRDPSPLTAGFPFFTGIELDKKRAFSADLYLILTMVIWGSDYPFAKFALREVSPLAFSAMRTLISTLILLPFFIRQEKIWSVSGRHLLGLISLAFLGTFMNRVCWSVGLNLTTASNSGLLMSTSPIFVLLFSSLFLRNEVNLCAALGIIIAFVGVFLVVEGDWKGWKMKSETFQGDLILIGAAIFWAMFTVLAKRFLKEFSSLKVTAYVMGIGTVLFSCRFCPMRKVGAGERFPGLPALVFSMWPLWAMVWLISSGCEESRISAPCAPSFTSTLCPSPSFCSLCLSWAKL